MVNLVTAFEGLAARIPAAVAVCEPGRSITFAELNARANALARRLAGRWEPGRPVPLYLEKGVDWLTGVWAVLKAGLAVAPVEMALPEERRALLVRDLDAPVILTVRGTPGIPDGPEPVYLDDAGEGDTENLDLPIGPKDLALIWYTSGSTGVPKGAMQDHECLVDQAGLYHGPPIDGRAVSEGDRVLFLTVNPGALFSSALSGAALMFLNDVSDFTAVARAIRAWRPTVIVAVASTIRSFAASCTVEDFRSVRLVRLGGEPVYSSDLDTFRRLFPADAVLRFGYGSTESNLVVQRTLTHASVVEPGRLHSGYPQGGKTISIVDGEIAVRGRFVGTGYWRRPEDTAARFAQHEDGTRTYLTGDTGRLLEDGSLLIEGRKDSSIKVRGSFVNLGAVEQVLQTVDGVAEAVVAGFSRGEEGLQLAAWLLPSSDPVSFDELRRRLEGKLAPGAVPSLFRWVESWPRTSSGKIDRLALPKPDGLRSSYVTGAAVAARDVVEERVLAIWAEVLELDEVGATDSFFDLGGDSLHAAAIAAQLAREFFTSLTPAAVFECVTPRVLAGRLDPPADLERLLAEMEQATSPEVFAE